MAYTEPPDFNAGDPLAAADLDILSDDIRYLKGITDGVTFSGIRVTRNAATSISNNTLTAITFTAEAYDYGGWWSSGTDLVVPAGAIPTGFTTIALDCRASCIFATNGTGRRYLQILHEGVNVSGPNVSADASEDVMIQGSAFVVAAAGDTISLSVKQTSGGALNVSSSNLVVARYAPVA